jgi:hypothetical protein
VQSLTACVEPSATASYRFFENFVFDFVAIG